MILLYTLLGPSGRFGAQLFFRSSQGGSDKNYRSPFGKQSFWAPQPVLAPNWFLEAPREGRKKSRFPFGKHSFWAPRAVLAPNWFLEAPRSQKKRRFPFKKQSFWAPPAVLAPN